MRTQSVRVFGYNPDDRRFDALARKSTATTIILDDGNTTALTLLLRIVKDALGEETIEVAVHFNRELDELGRMKLDELRAELDAAIAAAIRTVPAEAPILMDNIFWVTCDVLAEEHDGDRPARVLGGFDFGRAERAIRSRRTSFDAAFGFWATFGYVLLSFIPWTWPFWGTRAKRKEELILDEVRIDDALAAAKFKDMTAASEFLAALQEKVGPVFARIFAANLPQKVRKEIARRGRSAGRMTVVALGDENVGDLDEAVVLEMHAPAAPPMPSLPEGTILVTPAAPKPNGEGDTARVSHRPTIVSLADDDPHGIREGWAHSPDDGGTEHVAPVTCLWPHKG